MREQIKKYLTRGIAIAMASIMTMSLMAGCNEKTGGGGSQGSSGGKRLVIKFTKGGFGDEWLTAMKDAFEKAYKDEGYKVELEVVTDASGGTVGVQELKLGPDKNDIDLYIGSGMNLSNLLSFSYKVMHDKETPILEPLNDIYYAPAVGADLKPESKTIAERVFPGFENSYIYNGTEEAWKGNVFHLSEFAASTGLFVNTKVLDRYGLKIPNTTDEMAATVQSLAKKGAADGVYPFTWAGNNAPGYWSYLFGCLFAQYSGVDAYRNFVATIPPSGDVVKDGWKVYEDKGILEALAAMRPIMDLDYSPNGAVSFTHTQAQHCLMVGEAAFMVTGDWLLSEMRQEYFKEASTDVQMMKTPVVSSIGKELGITDSQLSQAIGMVDNGDSDDKIVAAIPGLTAEGAARIRTARNIYFSIGGTMQMVIPAYADAKEAAKKFIQFVYSEDGCRITRNNAYALAPVSCESYDVENSTPFLESVIKQMNSGKATAIFSDFNTSAVRASSGMLEFNYSAFASPNTFKSMMMDKKMTAQYMYEKELEYVKQNWSNYVAYAGLQ